MKADVGLGLPQLCFVKVQEKRSPCCAGLAGAGLADQVDLCPIIPGDKIPPMTDAAPKFSHGYPKRPEDHRVVVLGASPKPARYSNQAIRDLKERGYQVVPVHPKIAMIEHLPVVHSLRAISDIVHTLTLYVGPERSRDMIDDILHLHPRRVILNPGTESFELEQRLHERHIPTVHGCTLVMLRTAQF